MVLKKLLKIIQRPGKALSLKSPETIYAIGDIHGKLSCLNALLDKISHDLNTIKSDQPTHLIFLGDYVDRGEDTSGVLERLSGLAQNNTTPFDQITFLKGNHEDLILSFLNNSDFDDWLSVGGLETLMSYSVPDLLAHMRSENKNDMLNACLKRIPEAHLDFLYNSLKTSYMSGELFFCHAGIDPDYDLSRQHDRTLLWGHPDFMQRGGADGHTIIHGHRIRQSPDIGKNRLGVDTGAYHTGILSAVRIFDNDFKFITTQS